MLEHLRSKFTPATVNELARTLNENPASTQKAMDGLLPAVTAGVINRANQSDGTAMIHNPCSTTRNSTATTSGNWSTRTINAGKRLTQGMSL